MKKMRQKITMILEIIMILEIYDIRNNYDDDNDEISGGCRMLGRLVVRFPNQ